MFGGGGVLKDVKTAPGVTQYYSSDNKHRTCGHCALIIPYIHIGSTCYISYTYIMIGVGTIIIEGFYSEIPHVVK